MATIYIRSYFCLLLKHIIARYIFLQVTWKESEDKNEPLVRQITLSTNMESILGRELRKNDLKAALTFTRTFAKAGKEPQVMLQNFNTKVILLYLII